MSNKIIFITALIGVAIAASALTLLWESTRVVQLYCADPLESRDGQCLCPVGQIKMVGSDGVAHCWILPDDDFDVCEKIPDIPECKRPFDVPTGPDPENPVGKEP